MTSHCTISIEGSEVSVFKPHDGYQENMIPLLKKIVSAFYKERGFEPDMFLAYLVSELRNDLQSQFKTPLKTGLRLFSKSEFQKEDYNYYIDSEGKISEGEKKKPSLLDFETVMS